MRLDHLTLTDHRNFTHAELTPDPDLTVLCGANGQGKTNLLEAVWLLTGGKSFRAARDAELIRRGAPFSVLEAAFTGAGREQTIRLTVGGRESQRPGRYGRLNGVDQGRAVNMAGAFSAVVFEPNHLSLIKGGPDGRRRFLDAALCQLYGGYLGAARRYNRVVSQKNALLKSYDTTPGGAQLLEVFNTELAGYGTQIIRYRREYLDRIIPAARDNYRDISRGAETLEITYRPTADSELELRRKLEGMRAQELRAGFCLAGPHREDVEFSIDGQPARIYGSQGQQRSAVLALKLAEASVAGEILDEQPVMLLDDVLSELDDDRQTYLLTRIGKNQTFVTTCDTAAFARTNGKIVMVSRGIVTE